MAFTNTGSDRSSVDERFGYLEKGSFRLAFGNERPVLICALIAAFAIYLAIGLGIMYPHYQTTAFMFYTIVGAVLFLLDIAAFLTVYNVILKGKEASYSADSVKFTVKCGGKREIFYYEDVYFVRFEPYSLFGLTRGYLVTVCTKNGDYPFYYISPKKKRFGEPQETPFFILKQRSEGETSPVHEPVFDSQTDIERPVMPMVYSKLPENSVTTYVPESYKPQNNTIQTVSSEDELIISKGTFRIRYRNEFTFYIVIIVLTIAFTFVGIVMGDFIFIVAPILLGGGAFNMVLAGREISYKLNKKEFNITDKDSTRTIYICDVERIEYKDIMLLWKKRGYRVSIFTKYTEIQYDFLFPIRRKDLPVSSTPFYKIEELIGTVEQYQPSYRRS